MLTAGNWCFRNRYNKKLPLLYINSAFFPIIYRTKMMDFIELIRCSCKSYSQEMLLREGHQENPALGYSTTVSETGQRAQWHRESAANAASMAIQWLLPGDEDRNLQRRNSQKEETSQCSCLAGESCPWEWLLHFHSQCTGCAPSSGTHRHRVSLLCSRSARERGNIWL